MTAANYWISKVKEATGMTEPQIAIEVGTSQGTLGDAKKGRTRLPPHVSKRLAEILSIPYPYLLASIASDKAKDEEEKAAWLALIPQEIREEMTGIKERLTYYK